MPGTDTDDAVSRLTVTPDGDIVFTLPNGELHRVGGPAAIRKDGTLEYWLHGRLHRDNGPAIDGPGGRFWYLRGLPHRDGDPAAEWPDGTRKWYRHGVQISYDFSSDARPSPG